jgi:2,4-dienoyl-CoA reductase-like NADH-dependent reductase (Old Yellow Enzyme family)
LNQFLSRAVNHRIDEYGGALANRGRMVLEVLRSVRHAVGADYPVLIKINSEDYVEGTSLLKTCSNFRHYWKKQELMRSN